jgi:hypothetical protein
MGSGARRAPHKEESLPAKKAKKAVARREYTREDVKLLNIPLEVEDAGGSHREAHEAIGCDVRAKARAIGLPLGRRR